MRFDEFTKIDESNDLTKFAQGVIKIYFDTFW